MFTSFIVEAEQLNNFIIDPSNNTTNSYVAIVDVSTLESFNDQHIFGAVLFDYINLVSGQAPAPGLLPSIEQLTLALTNAGLHSDKTIIAYDNEGGVKASRLLWTLDVLGFTKLHLLNGGLHAWVQAQLPLYMESTKTTPTTTEKLKIDSNKVATKEYILENLGKPDVLIWDVRSEQEYNGLQARALRNGHIPGSINLNWLETIDHTKALRYLPDPVLIKLLTSKGITPDKEIIVHCQTHHRSSHSAMLLKHLGYPKIRAYPGSWSEWGNVQDTPIAL